MRNAILKHQKFDFKKPDFMKKNTTERRVSFLFVFLFHFHKTGTGWGWGSLSVEPEVFCIKQPKVSEFYFLNVN